MDFERYKKTAKSYAAYVLIFIKWLNIGLLLGVLGGLVGTAFCYSIGFVTGLREANPFLVWFLPLGGLVIVFLYKKCGLHPTDTNGVLLAVHTPASISPSTGPLIFVGSTITHLFGGSAGREGAALQLGGVLGWHTAHLLRQPEKDTHVVVMTGMSAVFAALFGTPITAAIFAMEVASVGILHFSAIVPCLTSSLVASHLALALGVTPESFPLAVLPHVGTGNVAGTMLVAAVCGVLSIIFCIGLKKGHKYAKKLFPDSYLRIAVAGISISILTYILGTNDYNGAGMHIVEHAIHGHAEPEAFLLKIIFTVITMSCGYKGGEIVPAMFIGATAGCVIGELMGLPVGLGAAVGLVSMFCGSLNCPISAIFLGLEIFGADNLHFFAIAAAVSYVLSGNFGLYSEQKIMYSKIHPEFINKYAD
ncbi:MAG: chloride channel protein [Oscillospiraceae bacterium]|nr:chloride channel protein [Oscillospiraceae bacterium]